MPYPEIVSIVMPAYNAGQFIGESIKSIIAQTFVHWELIVVDDGSTDDTRGIVSEFQKNDAKIKYIWQENGKQGKARNTGIKNAKGDLVAFQDADDLWVPDMLEKQLGLMKETNADLVFSSVKYADEQLNELDIKYTVHSKVLEGITGAEILLRLGNCIPMNTVLAKKQIIINAGAFKISQQTQFGEEYGLWIRMLLNHARLVCNDEPLALYIQHPNQSSRRAENKYLQLLRVIKELPDGDKNFKKQKDREACVRIRRCLRYSKNLDLKNLRELISFLPSALQQKMCLTASYFLPVNLLKKIIFKLSYFSQRKFLY